MSVVWVWKMNKKNKMHKLSKKALLASLVCLTVSGHSAWADVGGSVYRDLPLNGTTVNTYGVKEANELGVANITVTVTDSSGNNVVGSPTTTDPSGNWSILGTSGDLRVEFSNIPSYLQSSPVNTGSNTSVQFIADGDTANLGLHDPLDFSQPDPDIILPLHINGDPNAGGTAETEPGLILHAYNVTDGSSGANVNISTTGVTGATYGIAYQRDTGTVFSAAFVKRHVGLENSLGSIFITTDLYGTPNTTEYADLSALLGNFGILPARPDLPANITDPSVDAGVYAEVGKLGLGDLDISADGSKLYTVNLAAKSLLTIDIGNPAKAAGSLNAADITETLIPTPTCNNGQWRPFGLGVGSGKVFVGGVCDASSGVIGDLSGHVFTYDLATSSFDAGSVLDFPLDFARLPVNVNNPNCNSWKPWSDDFADAENYETNKYCLPQPIFSDIEFDIDGSLVFGFRDRFGDQFGHNNNAPDGSGLFQAQANGDVYRAHNNGGSFVFESNAVAGSLTGCGANNNDGPGGGEFYCEDGVFTHPNSSVGGAALLSGSGEVVLSMMDPINLWSGGTRWFNNTTGQKNKDYEVFNTGSGGTATFGKANGIGDLEFISSPAPLEIGNRVWEDVNGNGLQDAGEAGIDGVNVTLNCGGVDFTQTTANGGQYLFTDTNVTGGIPRDTDCTISVPTDVNGQVLTTQTTTTDETLGSNPDTGTGSFTFRSGLSGQNNHTYDIGYRNAPAQTVDLAITKVAVPTSANSGDNVTYTITVTNNGPDAATGVEVNDQLPAGVTYSTHTASQGTFTDTNGLWVVGDLAVNQSATLSITVLVD